MVKIISNTLRIKNNIRSPKNYSLDKSNLIDKEKYVPANAKMLAWGLFLVFFIENGTLGLLPKQAYFIYRNVRISDLLIYFLIIYSLFQSKEYIEYFKSRSLLITKLILGFFLLEFLISSLLYEFNLIEYFFRLKNLWASFLVFPYLLLIKRNGLNYLIRIILPCAIISNILYILSSLTGIAFLPEVGIVKQYLPGGLEVYRVFGGTFFGEFFFLGYIFNWITNRFRLYQLVLAILFIIPHILAFGRAAWVYFIFTIMLILIWHILKKREFKILLRQLIVVTILLITLIYSFIQFIPRADYISDALDARIFEGEEDVKFEKGTYGSRLAKNKILIELWLSNNIFLGIGMHPMWVYKPETEEESQYYSSFSDVRWTALLAAYGIIGFLLVVIFQIYYAFISLKLLKRVKENDIYVFFILLMLSTLLFDTLINYSYNLVSITLTGMTFSLSLFVAIIVLKYEEVKKMPVKKGLNRIQN